MKSIYRVGLVIIVICLQTCKTQPKKTVTELPKTEQSTPQKFYNETKLLNAIETLSSDEFEGRKTGTKGNEKARQYIINQLST